MALTMPKTQREQLMVLLGVIGLLAAGAYWYLVYSPASAKLAIESARVDKLDSLNTSAKKMLAMGTESELRAQAQVYTENLELMRQLVPASNEVPTLVDQIATSARRAGLDVSKLEPMGPEQGQDFDGFRYKLTVTGGYHDITEFLTNVGSMSRIVVPVNVQMTALANASNNPRKAISTVVELHTYVAHAAPAPAKGGK